MIDSNAVIASLVAITLFAGVAARRGTPYPVVLVLGGSAMGIIPGLPSLQLTSVMRTYPARTQRALQYELDVEEARLRSSIGAAAARPVACSQVSSISFGCVCVGRSALAFVGST